MRTRTRIALGGGVTAAALTLGAGVADATVPHCIDGQYTITFNGGSHIPVQEGGHYFDGATEVHIIDIQDGGVVLAYDFPDDHGFDPELFVAYGTNVGCSATPPPPPPPSETTVPGSSRSTTPGEPPRRTGQTLPATGDSSHAPLVAGGVLALALGGGLVAVARTRDRAWQEITE